MSADDFSQAIREMPSLKKEFPGTFQIVSAGSDPNPLLSKN
jgi:hypothetical protein